MKKVSNPDKTKKQRRQVILSGDNVSCPGANAAFGRCSTSQRSGSGGDCNNLRKRFAMVEP